MRFSALTISSVLLFGAVVVVPILPGCTLAAAFPESLVLFVSGDSRVYSEPCGSRRDQAGGLPGRATVIGKKPAANRLVFDVGNLSPGSRPYELLKLRYLAQGMAKIGYDAVTWVVPRPSWTGRPSSSPSKAAMLPFVSANVVDRELRKPLVEPYRIVSRGKLRVGVTDPQDSRCARRWRRWRR